MKRTVDCSGCAHWREGLRGIDLGVTYIPMTARIWEDHVAGDYLFACVRGHRPRFYRPRDPVDDFGWRRRCEDYEARP